MKSLLLAFGLLVFSLSAIAADIELTWTSPTEKEDGSAITSIDRFNLYYSIDNVVQNAIEIQADANSYTLVDVAQGAHTFQISTVSEGLEGEASSPITVSVSENASKPVRIELTVRVID